MPVKRVSNPFQTNTLFKGWKPVVLELSSKTDFQSA